MENIIYNGFCKVEEVKKFWVCCTDPETKRQIEVAEYSEKELDKTVSKMWKAGLIDENTILNYYTE